MTASAACSFNGILRSLSYKLFPRRAEDGGTSGRKLNRTPRSWRRSLEQRSCRDLGSTHSKTASQFSVGESCLKPLPPCWLSYCLPPILTCCSYMRAEACASQRGLGETGESEKRWSAAQVCWLSHSQGISVGGRKEKRQQGILTFPVVAMWSERSCLQQWQRMEAWCRLPVWTRVLRGTPACSWAPLAAGEGTAGVCWESWQRARGSSEESGRGGSLHTGLGAEGVVSGEEVGSSREEVGSSMEVLMVGSYALWGISRNPPGRLLLVVLLFGETPRAL